VFRSIRISDLTFIDRVNPPNLFHFATSELSQNALLCWLLAWADSRWKNLDPNLHRLGVRFVSALLALHDKKLLMNGSLAIRVERQICRADIVAEINNAVIIAIADNTTTCSDQGNHELMESLGIKYPNREVLPVFITTGDQASYSGAHSPPLLRAQLIALLHEDERLLSRNAILNDFCLFLEQRETDVQAWRYRPVVDWCRQYTPWIGFFQSLQTEFVDLDWKHVPNAHGGFIGAWWNWRPWDRWRGVQLYLQISHGPLQFRVSGLQHSDNAILSCQEAALQLRRMGCVHKLEIEKTRLQRGETMTIAQIERDFWIAVRPDGLIDLTRTLDNLRLAASILESISTPELPPPSSQLLVTSADTSWK
jgi:hypothetical protein